MEVFNELGREWEEKPKKEKPKEKPVPRRGRGCPALKAPGRGVRRIGGLVGERVCVCCVRACQQLQGCYATVYVDVYEIISCYRSINNKTLPLKLQY
mgnify:CR=1 FL=1